MGLIHLYSATSTTFDHNGTPLVTAREAVVKRDEGFQLTFSIPISQNELHKSVHKEMIVSAMTPDGVNYFRIWDIEKRTTDVKVTALQLLYSLDVKQVNPFGGKQYTGTTILQAFVNSFKSSISPYTFSSSIMTSKDFYTNEEDDTSTSHNALAILNKITDNWSGELMLNGFDVRMISKLGTKTDALLYEHKNIASFSDSSSMNGIVTRIYATATYTPERAEGAEEDPEPVVISATVDSPLINQYAVIYEATAEYNDARTEAELRTEILKQYSEFNVDKPERTIDVDTNIVDGTAINFGDELVLKYLVHDVDEVIRCVGYEYDPISENYIGVTLGTLEKTFLTKVTEGISSAVTRQFDKLNKQIQVVQTSANGKNRVTYGPNPVPNAIEGDLWFKHPEGRPDEIELLIYQNGLWLPAPFLTDQDKLAFEQEMSDHYDAALAEIERKDAEYKEVFDAYDEKVVEIDQEISDAATKAQSALEAAGISTDLAQTAKDLADTAQADAQTAKTNASTAQADASAAVTNANQAKADAQTAKTNAQTAIDDAQTALTNANQASEDSQTAITQAGQAVVSANTAKTNAQTALTDAQEALSTAKNADTKSGLAEIAANTAKTNAQTALDNSSTAITNAADAITKAGQAETTANTAKTNAQTALDDAQSALTTAGSADTKAGQAIAKANAIPTTITDIIADKNLVNGTYVDTKVNDATGAWSQELVRVEGVIDGIEIGGRNLLPSFRNDRWNISPATSVEDDYLISQPGPQDSSITIDVEANTVYTYTFNTDYARSSIRGYIDGVLNETIFNYINGSFVRTFNSGDNNRIIITLGKYSQETRTATTRNLKLEKGNKATDWTPAPEDLYSQEEFKIFNAQYSQDVTGITGRLTTVESDKLDGSTFQTFKQAEYQVTADKVASTITRVDTAEGKIATQGTAISQQATAIASKADKTVVDTLSGTVSAHGTLISQNATDISSKADSELVDDIKGTVDTHTTEISQNATDIASKASSTSVNALTGRVSTAETTISQHATAITSKASQTEVDTVKGTVSSHTTTLGQHATAISSKAESSLVDTIKDTVDTHTTDISQNATDIASKASSTSVNALTGRVSTAESNISQNATAITQRVTTTTYNTGIASKENTVLKQSTAPAHVNGRLWLDTSATPNILKRSTGTAWVKATPTTPGEVGAYSQSAGAGLAGRLTTAETTITQTATAIQSKADQTEVDTVKGTVSGHTTTLSQHATDIASKAESSLVNTIKGTVDTHTTEIGQNATDIASKASSSSVNTLTGRVSTAESNIGQNATAISQRVTTTTYNTGIASKENSVLKQSAAPSHLNGRLWLDTSVTPNILKRSTGTSWVKATPTTASEVGAYSSGQGSALAGRVTTAETNITQTATAIESKADQTEVDTVKGTVSGHTTTLSQHATAIASKADSSLVNTIKGTVDTHTTEISQNATAIASKASSSSVSTLTGRVSTAETTITQHATSIASKASQTEVDTVKGTVSGHTSTLSQHASQISARLTSSQVNTLVDNKGFSTVNYVDNQITASASGIRADMSVVEGKIPLDTNDKNYLTNSETEWGTTSFTSNSAYGVYRTGQDMTDIFKELVGEIKISVDVFIENTEREYASFRIYGTNGSPRYQLNSLTITNVKTNEWVRVSGTTSIYDRGTGIDGRIELYGEYIASTTKIRIRKMKIGKVYSSDTWSPAPEDTLMENDFNIFKASYEATAESLTSRLTAVDKVGGRLSTAETNISQNATAISSKANTSTVNTLTGRVSTAETTISQHATAISSKASQQEVNTVKGTVSGHTTTLSQHATAIASKANTSTVNTLTGRVSTAETTITQHATSIASKASQNEVDTVKGTVSGHTTTLSQHATQISARLTTSQVNSLVDGKGFSTVTYVDSQITATSDSFGVELTKVEGKIPTEIGTRNYFVRKDAVLDSALTWYTGAPFAETNSLLTGYIPTSLGDEFRASVGPSGGQIAFYNSGKQFVGSRTMSSGIVIVDGYYGYRPTPIPSNETIAFMRISLRDGYLIGKSRSELKVMINKGTIIADWELSPEEREIDAQSYVNNQLSITSNSINSKITGILGDINKRKNLIPYTELGAIAAANGVDWDAEQAQNRRRTPMIDVRGFGYRNLVLSINEAPPNGNWWLFRYRPDGTYVDHVERAGGTSINVTDNIGFVRAVWYGASDGKFQLEIGDSITSFVPYSSNVSQYQIVKATQDLDGFKQTVQNTYGTKTEMSTISQKANSIEALVGVNGSNIAQIALTSDLLATKVRELPSGANLQPSISDGFAESRAGVIRITDNVIRVTFESQDGSTPYINLPHVSLTEGTIYTLSFKVTLLGGSGDRSLNYGIRTGGFADRTLTLSPNVETYVKHTFTATAATDVARVIMYSNGFRQGVRVDIKDMVLNLGSTAFPWTPSLKPIESQVSQLAGSWALTLKSGNDIKTQINASTNSIRIASNLIYLSGSSIIDNAVIKSAMIDTLNVSKLTGTTAEFTTLRSKVITAGSISADRLVAGTALVDRVFIDSAAIKQLTSKSAFITNIQAISIDVGKITGNTASFISAGFTSLNSQATINGNAIRIQNTAGEFVEMNNTPELRSDDAGGTAVVLGKGRVHFYDSRGYSKGYVGTDMHTAGSYDFGTFLSKGSGIYKFARMADATQTTYAYYTVKAGITSPSGIITNMVQNGYLPDGNAQQFVAKGNMLSQLNGWPAYPNWPTLKAGQQIRYKELTTQTTGDAYEDIWKFGPSSNGDWRIYFAKHATFEGGTTGTSDRRLKHDIETTQVEALGHIESLTFKEFKWNRDNKYEPLGLIAQDSGIIRVSDDDMEGIDIQRAIMLGLKGIQELQEIVKEQAEEIRQLKEINNQ